MKENLLQFIHILILIFKFRTRTRPKVEQNQFFSYNLFSYLKCSWQATTGQCYLSQAELFEYLKHKLS